MIRYAAIVDPRAFVALDFFGSVAAVFTGGFFYILVRCHLHHRGVPMMYFANDMGPTGNDGSCRRIGF